MITGALVSRGEKDDKEKWCVFPVMYDDYLVLKLTVSKLACDHGCTVRSLSHAQSSPSRNYHPPTGYRLKTVTVRFLPSPSCVSHPALSTWKDEITRLLAHSLTSHAAFSSCFSFSPFSSSPRMMLPSRSHNHVATVYCHYLNDFDCALHFPCRSSEDHVPPVAFPSTFSTASYLVFRTAY
jgi:hypothetical protein